MAMIDPSITPIPPASATPGKHVWKRLNEKGLNEKEENYSI